MSMGFRVCCSIRAHCCDKPRKRPKVGFLQTVRFPEKCKASHKVSARRAPRMIARELEEQAKVCKSFRSKNTIESASLVTAFPRTEFP